MSKFLLSGSIRAGEQFVKGLFLLFQEEYYLLLLKLDVVNVIILMSRWDNLSLNALNKPVSLYFRLI